MEESTDSQPLDNGEFPMNIILYGKIVSGLGEGKVFTELPWAKEQFINKVGIDPYPGTLNLRLENPEALKNLQKLKICPGKTIVPDNPTFCKGVCYQIMVQGSIPGAIIIPLIPGYPDDKLEIISPYNLKERLRVEDGDEITITYSRQDTEFPSSSKCTGALL
jgi:CTP-dependent riboflavin kinase